MFCSINVTMKENHFKLIYWWYLTPQKIKIKIKRVFPQTDGKSWKCQKDDTGFLHMWWGCCRIKAFWYQVHEIIQEIFGRERSQTPRVMLLCDFSGCKIGVLGPLLAGMLIVAAILIMSKWKLPEIPTISEWLNNIRYIDLMCKLTALRLLEWPTKCSDELL